jgi:pimeloyl-ACP methyl ester carboxylesterase
VYVRLFAAQYPDEVAGLVLVDTPSAAADAAMPEAIREYTASQVQEFPQLASIAAAGFMTPEQMPVPAFMERDEELAAQYQYQLANSGFFRAMYAETNAMPEIVATLNDITLPDDSIVTVIAAGVPDTLPEDLQPIMDEYHETVWLPELEALAESLDGTYVLAEDSQHHVQFDAFDVVLEAVLNVADTVRSMEPGS